MNNPGLTREQKTGAVLLFVFALMAVGLGLLQLRNTIYNPFVIKGDTAAAQPLVLDEKTRLQQIDTDHDGLNDYEEIYFYNTSPYLADTDSDGIPDKQEIDNGTDPLCPQGQVCVTAEATNTNTTTIASPLVPVDGLDPVKVFGSVAPNPDGATQPTGSTIDQLQSIEKDPKTLRELLIKSGKITKAELDQIDDATLLKFAQQLASEQSAPAAPASAGASSPGLSSSTRP